MDQMGMVSTKRKKPGRKGFEDKAEEAPAESNSLLEEDFTAALGIGGYEYGIVLCKVSENYWAFKPLKSLDSAEAIRACRELCGQMDMFEGNQIATLTVYCDAH